jgi:hypothetical protein
VSTAVYELLDIGVEAYSGAFDELVVKAPSAHSRLEIIAYFEETCKRLVETTIEALKIPLDEYCPVTQKKVELEVTLYSTIRTLSYPVIIDSFEPPFEVSTLQTFVHKPMTATVIKCEEESSARNTTLKKVSYSTIRSVVFYVAVRFHLKSKLNRPAIREQYPAKPLKPDIELSRSFPRLLLDKQHDYHI